MPPNKPKKSSPDADDIERQIMSDLAGGELDDEDLDDEDLDEEDLDDLEFSTTDLLEDLHESLRLAYLMTVDVETPVAVPPGNARAEALNRCSLAAGALATSGRLEGPARDPALEYLLDAHRTATFALDSGDLDPELAGALRLIKSEIDRLVPEAEVISSAPPFDAEAEGDLEDATIVELAELLPDAGGVNGGLATRRTMLEWIAGRFPDMRPEDAVSMASSISAYDVADVRAMDEVALLRLVCVRHDEGDVAYVCVKSDREETECVADVALERADPRTWENFDRMKAVSVVIDALAGFAFDDVSVVFRPLFASFANPFGPITVGGAPGAEDRRAARAARIKASKRRH